MYCRSNFGLWLFDLLVSASVTVYASVCAFFNENETFGGQSRTECRDAITSTTYYYAMPWEIRHLNSPEPHWQEVKKDQDRERGR